jgi:RNA polymerase sigma-70 factor (ECF subfamily)
MKRDALYREVTEQHGPAIGRISAAYEADLARRLELLQDLHASVWRSLEVFDGRCALRTWVFRVVLNVATAHLTRRARARLAEPEAGLARFLHGLEPLERQLMVLYLEGLDARAIAEIAGLSSTHVASRLLKLEESFPARVPVTRAVALWNSRREGPIAFTSEELGAGRVAPASDPVWMDCAGFLEGLLIRLQQREAMQLLWVPVAFCAMALALPWDAPTVLLRVIALVIAGVQVWRRRETWGALRSLREMADPRGKRRFMSGGVALGVCAITAMVSTDYWAYGQAHAREAREEAHLHRQERALAACRKEAPVPVASAACDEVLREQPDNREVIAVLPRLRVRRVCEEELRTADVLAEEGHPEQALLQLEALGAGCPESVMQAAARAAIPLLESAMTSARSECLEVEEGARAAASPEALPRCAVYLRYACQRPPLAGGARDGRSVDPLGYLKLAAENRPWWRCPDSPLLRAIAQEYALTAGDWRWLDRYAPSLQSPMRSFGSGDLQQAKSALYRLPFEGEVGLVAKALVADVEAAETALVAGRQLVDFRNLEAAEPSYLRVLAIEARLVNRSAEETSRNPTELRKEVLTELATGWFERGRSLVAVRDFRGACRAWKRGSSFDPTNVDVRRAVTEICTPRAEGTLHQAASCDELSAVLELAVEGDGVRERVDRLIDERGCAP